MKRKKISLILLSALLVSLTLSQVGCYKKKLETKAGLFSWSFSSAFEDKETLFEMLEDLGLGSLYQEFPRNTDLETLTEFLLLAQKYNIDVYYLAGTPEWGLDQKGESMLEYIEYFLALNAQVPKQAKCKGIILDVEPYLTDEWKEHQVIVLNKYISAMQKAYQRISEDNLETILCIPYFFDTLGYEEQLDTLIRESCDTIAVMNYYKTKEEEHIKQEITLACQYDKGIIQIYELKEPGTHGIVEKNTYYKGGIQEVLESWEKLKAFASYNKFNFALHDYKAVKEVLKRE